MRFRKYLYLTALLLGALFVSTAFGVDYRSLIGREDINLTHTDNGAQETYTRRTSTGGSVSLNKLEGNAIPWSNAYTRTVRPKSVSGDNTGTVTGYRIVADNVSINGNWGVAATLSAPTLKGNIVIRSDNTVWISVCTLDNSCWVKLSP